MKVEGWAFDLTNSRIRLKQIHKIKVTAVTILGRELEDAIDVVNIGNSFNAHLFIVPIVGCLAPLLHVSIQCKTYVDVAIRMEVKITKVQGHTSIVTR